MSKNKGEIGFKTNSVYDSKNDQFAKEGKYYLINMIDTYYTDNNIIGFFPLYSDKNLQRAIEKDSTYSQYKETFKNIHKKSKGSIKHELTEFEKGEYIKFMKILYNENDKKIEAIKFSTNKKTYSYGNHTRIDRRDPTTLRKEDHFIPGFRTNYLKDNNDIPYLCYIRAHFGREENEDKYIKKKSKNPHQSSSCCGLCKVFSLPFTIFDYIVTLILSIVRKGIKILFPLLVILLPIIYYFYVSQNLANGTIKLNSFNSSYTIKGKDIKIVTDEYGFSHIHANNPIDGYFGLGFEHGKNRLWQIDITRRMARGKLSEIFGKKGLNNDLIIRSIGLNDRAETSADFVRKNSKYLAEINAYIDGINFYGENFILPIEYQITRAKFERWTLEDIVGIMNFYSIILGHDWGMEIWYKAMEDSLGKEFADLVMKFRDVDYPFWNETIVNDDELYEMGMHLHRKRSEDKLAQERDITRKVNRQKVNETNTPKDSHTEQGKYNHTKQDKPKDNNTKQDKSKDNNTKQDKPKDNNTKQDKLKDNHSEQDKPKDNQKNQINTEKSKPKRNEPSKEKDSLEIPSQSSEGASNCWAINGEHTKSGKPLLSNDPHLPNSMPVLFFIAKIYLPDNTITGSTLPGTPFFATGSNKYISWGLTTENSDNTDLCEEKLDDNTYKYDNKDYHLESTEEIIHVKGDSDVIQNVFWTRNGPIIPNTIAKEFTLLNREFKTDIPLSLRSPIFFKNFTNFEFYFKLFHAKSSKDFLPYVDLQVSPNYNLHWAEKSGEIGWIPLGRFNIKSYENRFCDGSSKADNIQKEIRRVELPKLISPKKGFIVSANNKLASFNYTYKLHGHHNHVRAYRIREMIEEYFKNGTKIGINETIKMIDDVKDSLAEYILPKLLEIIKRNTKTKNKYFTELEKWKYNYDKDSTAATIYAVLEEEIGLGLLNSKIKDETFSKSFMNYLHYWNFVSGLIDKIYKGENINLKNCVHGSGNTNCEKYLIVKFEELDMALEKYKNKDGSIKKWGEVSFNDLPHIPFEKQPFLRPFFSKKSVTGGNRNTVKISRNAFNHYKGDFTSTHSPRLKFICDLADPTRPFITIGGGNSGSPLGKYYSNLLKNHENSQLVQIKDVDFNKSESILIIENEK